LSALKIVTDSIEVALKGLKNPEGRARHLKIREKNQMWSISVLDWG